MQDFSHAKAHKYGGSSLAAADQFRNIQQQLGQDDRVIVVSATAGTTQALTELLDQATHHIDIRAALSALTEKHHALIDQLLEGESRRALQHIMSDTSDLLSNLLHTTQLIHTSADEIKATVLGMGERWSAEILAAYLNQFSPCEMINAREVLYVHQQHPDVIIDWPRSRDALAAHLSASTAERFVITGFVASRSDGKPITLDRNSSDFSATIFAKLLGIRDLTIWTDIDGIYSADPRRVHTAFPIPYLTYKEACELAYFGAKVLHPAALAPAMDSGTCVRIKNSFSPEQPGTTITDQHPHATHKIKGITSIDTIDLITITGTGMLGVSGIITRAFHALTLANVSVMLITQSSSEQSICFAVHEDNAITAEQALAQTFALEIQANQISAIHHKRGCSVLAVVGDHMVGSPGISATLFNALARANINVIAIAQGASERNISVVIERKDTTPALRAVHAGFYLSEKRLQIGIIGPGSIGSTLIEQIHQHQHSSLAQQTLLHIRGIMNSKTWVLDDRWANCTWQTALQEGTQPANAIQFAEALLRDECPHTVIIDCSASAEIAQHYETLIKMGVHIITPNKRANSECYDRYRRLMTACQRNNRQYLYETTVCAGLPVIKTLQDLIQTGDQIKQITAVVSGTLSFIFNALAEGTAFSTVIERAMAAGFTEPDPREDLTGMDVARKMVCLAREMGFPTTLEQVHVTNLVPEALREQSLNTFLKTLPEYDDQIADQIQHSIEQGQRAAYLGRIDQHGTVTVGIEGVSKNSPFYRLTGADNMVVFTTERYCTQPLVIQGPGAGAAVTAAGIFTDMLQLARHIKG